MKKFLFLFIAILSSLIPAMARVCILDNPTTMMTPAQFATLSDRVVAIENPSVDISFLSLWASTAGSLNVEGGAGGLGGAWFVNANQYGIGSRTIGGQSMCSDTTTGAPYSNNGLNCWCRMMTPQAGNWVLWGNNGESTIAACVLYCGIYCGEAVANDSDAWGNPLRAAILSLP